MEKKKPCTRRVACIGGDADDFEIIEVRVYRTTKDRVTDTIWTVTATVAAVTIATVFIIPLFG